MANLSWQWAGLTDELAATYQRRLGAERISGLETHGKFFDAGATVAYNSDWSIDPPDEWFNFQVGLTRRLSPEHPRLKSDRDLTVNEVLRAATINAAYALGREDVTGSLEPGKFADLIVLDGKPVPDNRTDIARQLDEHISKCKTAEDFSGDYLMIRYFQKGSAHIKFLRPDLMEKMNDILVRHYPGALPAR